MFDLNDILHFETNKYDYYYFLNSGYFGNPALPNLLRHRLLFLMLDVTKSKIHFDNNKKAGTNLT